MNVLEKILEEIEEHGNIQFSSYTKPLIAVEDVLKYIRSHMDDAPKCGECSRRKWYQIGYEDGKKKDGWIPVEERLPEEDERYKGRKAIDILVTTSNERVTKVQRQSKYDHWCWGRIYGEPTAWQPLPKPYKEK